MNLSCLSPARRNNLFSPLFGPQPLGSLLGTPLRHFLFRQLLIKPFSLVFTGLGTKGGVHLPKIFRHKCPNLLLPLHQNTQGRRLNPTGRR